MHGPFPRRVKRALCAEEIISRLGERAFRRPAQDDDLSGLMGSTTLGAAEGGFELGVRTALEAMLASPDFVFRFEPAAEASSRQCLRIADSRWPPGCRSSSGARLRTPSSC